MDNRDKDNLMEILCEAAEIKEQMRSLYAQAADGCSDDIGTGTFKMLEELEKEHLNRLSEIQAEISRGEATLDSCRYYAFDSSEKREMTRRILRERKTLSRACLDDIASIETGLQLENRAIDFFMGRLKNAVDPAERDFLNNLISEERSHYIVLADLKFYYVDPEHWLMEKGRTELDGAGMSS